MQLITIEKNQAGQRLDKFLNKYLPEAGSSFLYKMLRKKNITLNGKKAEGKEILNLGDEIRCFFAEETFQKFRGNGSVQANSSSGAKNNGANRDGNIAPNTNVNRNAYKNAYRNAFRQFKGKQCPTVLYEDEDILILNKPAGVLTQKASPSDISLNEWMIGYLLENGAITEEELETFHPSVCNRLDRNTSGIVLCGKSLLGSQELSRMIKERTIEKYYHTICKGTIAEEQLLEGYLVKDHRTNKVTIHKTLENASGDYIKTAYRPLAISPDGEYTYLEVELFTGKTHQIRAHLASVGHPLIGDFKYGNVKINQNMKQRFGLSNQLLHAHHVIFPKEHRLADLSITECNAPLPAEFERILKDLSAWRNTY